jgi:hypothetical protein
MEHLESQLTAADATLTDNVLDRIDGIVAPGTTINVADNGWTQPSISDPATPSPPRRPVPCRSHANWTPPGAISLGPNLAGDSAAFNARSSGCHAGSRWSPKPGVGNRVHCFRHRVLPGPGRRKRGGQARARQHRREDLS